MTQSPTADRTSLRARLFRSPMAAACLIGVSIVAGAALRSPATPAMAPAPPAPATIGMVDLAKLMNGLHEIKSRNDQNQVEGQKLQDDLTKISEQVEKLRNDLKAGGAIPEKDYQRRSVAMAEFIQKSALLKASKEAYQNLYDTKRGNIIHELYDKIIPAVDAFAKREGYDLVLLDDRAIQLPPLFAATVNDLNPVVENKRILYAKDGMDITDRLITVMNNQFDATNPAPVTPVTPAPAPSSPSPTNPK